MKEKELPLGLLSEEVTGIYESLRAYEGVLFRAEEHLDRFFDSAKTLGLEVPGSRKEVRKRLEKELAESGQKEAFVRLTLVGRELFVIVGERKHPPEMYQQGISLRTTPVRRKHSNQEFPEAKSTGCLNQLLATLEPAPPENYEILFLNGDGYLTEARIGNFFIIQKGCLLTPPPVGLLNGVTRRFVIECARRGKIPFEERPLMRYDLFNAEEAFLTNTSWEILSIREVDGRRIGSTLPGRITQKLQRIFRYQVEKEISKRSVPRRTVPR